jgi:hypothetical protein
VRYLESSVNAGAATSNADRASGRQGEEQLTDAIGEGLAAIAYGLLDVAAAIRSHAETMQEIHEAG